MRTYPKIGPGAHGGAWANRYEGAYMATVDGGYPCLYYALIDGVQDSDPLCAPCATVAWSERGELVNGLAPYYEGPPIECAHCNATIVSAYGDPERPYATPEGRPEICEGDYKISEHSSGHTYVTYEHQTTKVQGMDGALEFIREAMDASGDSPNVWRINERGNTDILALEDGGAYRIVESWV